MNDRMSENTQCSSLALCASHLPALVLLRSICGNM